MDNYSGVPISTSHNEFLTRLEQDLGIPIRVIDSGSRPAVPNFDASERMQNEWGLSSTVLDVDYGGFGWRPVQHPTGFDMEEGLTILSRGLFVSEYRNWTGRDLNAQARCAEGTNGRAIATRIAARRNHGSFAYARIEAPVPEWVEDYEAIPFPDWRGQDGHPYERPIMAARATLEGIGRVLAYPFMVFDQRTGTPAEGRVDREVLLENPIRETIANVEEMRARRMERAKERFGEFSTGRLSTRVQEVRNTVAGLETDSTQMFESLAATQDRLREEKLTLDTLIAMQKGEQPTIDPETEWEALNRHEKVDKFTVVGDRLTFETVDLTLTDPDTGESAPLGRFRISFPMGPGSGRGIQIENLTNGKDDGSGRTRAHPHVANGRPCFGNIMNEIARMGAAGEVGGMLELLLQYLQTYNPRDDYGRFAGLWFEGDVRERVRTDGEAEDDEINDEL